MIDSCGPRPPHLLLRLDVWQRFALVWHCPVICSRRWARREQPLCPCWQQHRDSIQLRVWAWGADRDQRRQGKHTREERAQSKEREREGKSKMVVDRREMTVRNEGRGEVSGEKGEKINTTVIVFQVMDTFRHTGGWMITRRHMSCFTGTIHTDYT